METRKLIILLAFQLSFGFFLPILVYNRAAEALDICEKEQRCSSDGPAIKFPFWLEDKQPKNCGYPGFGLHCDNDKNTIIELPTSAKFFVKTIDYKYDFIQLTDPQGCPWKQLRNLNLSSSLLQFSKSDRFSLFNCSVENTESTRWVYGPLDRDCRDSPGYAVYAVPTDTKISSLRLELCTKMHDTGLVPEEIFRSENLFKLSWTIPLCQACYNAGGTCRLEDGTENSMTCRVNSPGKSPNVGIITGSVIGSLILLVSISVLCSVQYRKKKEKENQGRIQIFLEDYRVMKPSRYSYADMKRITNDFKDKLGEGAYGMVFKGKLSNEVVVAVKLLHDSTGNGVEFINEVGTIGRIHHVNVVRLIGFCADGSRRALIYEFLPNGSLDQFIFGTGEQQQNRLGWEKLQDVALGIAKGIEYLHQGCEQRILHFDIKPHNILLDNNLNPKISDFGLAKLCEKGRSAVSMTAARGTMGYMAPEVYSRHFGNVSYKSDIYSFGMLLLEMVIGHRKNFDENVSLPEWVYRHLVNGEELGFQWPGENKIDRKLAIIGLWCTRWNPVDRPSITSVLQMLQGDGENLNLPPNPLTSTNPTMHKRPLQGSELEVISESEMTC